MIKKNSRFEISNNKKKLEKSQKTIRTKLVILCQFVYNCAETANATASVRNALEPNKLSVGFPIKFLGYTLFTNYGDYDVWDTGIKGTFFQFSILNHI